jgi:hypothetical protein
MSLDLKAGHEMSLQRVVSRPKYDTDHSNSEDENSKPSKK